MGCPDMHLSIDTHRDYLAAMADARKAQGAADREGLIAAQRRLTAASEAMRPCVRDRGHEPPHRDADGAEWGMPDPDEDFEPDYAAAVEALDAIDGDSDPEDAHGKADAALLAAVPPSVAAAYKRLVERARWWAGA